MNYLDYLPDCEYADLPAEVRAEVDRQTYEEARAVALAFPAPEQGLPPVLAAAFSKAVGASRQSTGRVPGKSVKSKGELVRTPLPWLAAAGWLLFLSVGMWTALRPVPTEFVYRKIPAPAPIAIGALKYITQVDTLYVEKVRYKTSYVTVIDTVEIEKLHPERLVLIRDTIYVIAPPPVLLTRSASLEGRENVLQFLHGTD
ncbi:hypothetical protein [Neolewinella antarctica]|uniref:DUF304 domain-containing protein n=1 Tax=Neolewinella antarctica TaxID=442734 RepID=A0ABX0XDW1_9BACT|nr:hypothetical protein [Neolewinella antarctica]NJC27094.1 hypothetical protein [Neolewinella antarctica]